MTSDEKDDAVESASAVLKRSVEAESEEESLIKRPFIKDQQPENEASEEETCMEAKGQEESTDSITDKSPETTEDAQTKTEPQTPKPNPPKFIFGSAAKNTFTFTSVAQSAAKADFSHVSSAISADEEVEDAESVDPFAVGNDDETAAEETFAASGEEKEITVDTCRGKLFELCGQDWKERGLGLAKINEDKETKEARLLMRHDGVLRLLLNIRLFSGLRHEIINVKNIRLAGIVEGKTAVYLFRTKSPSDAARFSETLAKYCSI